MSMLSFIFMIVCGFFFIGSVICAGFLSFDYICIAVGEPVIKRGRVGFPLTGLTPPHFCACTKPGPGFPM